MSATKFNVSITPAGRVTRNSGDSLASVQVGQWLKVSGGFYEVMTASSVDCTLDEWAGGALTADAKVLPTVGNVNAATESLREVSIFGNGLLGQHDQYATGTGFVTFTTAAGVDVTVPTIAQQIIDKNLSFNAFGLGLTGNAIAPLPVTSIDTLGISTGTYRVTNTNTGDRPDGFSDFGILTVGRYDATFDTQRYIDVGGNTASRIVRPAGVDAWDIDFNSGNSINPLDFGLGPRSTIPDLANENIDDVVGNGFFTGYGGNSGNASTGDNPFPYSGGAFNLICQKGVNPTSNEYSTQIATSLTSAVDVPIRFRTKNTIASGWGNWVDVFTSGNTNFNEFNYGGGEVMKSSGKARTSLIVDVNMQINSTVEPTSITTSGAGFNVQNAETGSVIATGIQPTLAPPSGKRNAIYRFTLTGAVTGTDYIVTAAGVTNSKVNF